MSNEDQKREQWADHLRDEAVELESQQRAAGVGHGPLDGPLPHSIDDLESAILAERERCAGFADRWGSEAELQVAFGDMTEWELRAAAEVARAIARSIRGTGSR